MNSKPQRSTECSRFGQTAVALIGATLLAGALGAGPPASEQPVVGGEPSENAADPRAAVTPEEKVERYEQRMSAVNGPNESVPPLRGINVAPTSMGPTTTTQPDIDVTIWMTIPDPSMAPEVFAKRLQTTRYAEQVRREYQRIYADATLYVKEIERPRQYRLPLSEALRRSLAGNFQIRIDSFAPAISTAQVVLAESAFDTAFFAQINRTKTDRPLIDPKLPTPQTDTKVIAGGIRQLLTSGAQVTLTENISSVGNRGVARINPVWSNNFVAELRQPLLRNFGIDVNRSQINIRKTERKINEEAFRSRVIQVLNATERAYWDLSAARREVTIGAELLAQAQLTLRQVQARRDFDAYQTLLSAAQSTVSQRQFIYIQLKNTVRNAEDQLLNLLNDKDLPMSNDWEVIPIDMPTTIGFERDRVHEVEVALRQRPEVIQARHAVDITRVQLGFAKNQALPQLDAVYRMTLNGIGNSADNSFDQMTTANFVDNFVGLELTWNFAERGERAGIRVAALQQSRAVATYKKALDDIITDCRVALRNLDTAFEQLSPSRDAVASAVDRLRALQERQERKSPSDLDAVFNAQVALAEARRSLLSAVVGYNEGIVDVERAKGTLIDYDNVVIANEP